MARRGENIRKRNDGRWEGRIISNNSFGSKSKYKSIYGKSYTEVKAKIKEYQEIKPQKTYNSFSNLCTEWLETSSIKLKQSSFSLYKRNVEGHILPFFKPLKIANISNDDIDRFILEKSSISGLSSKTMGDLISLLNQIMEYAYKKGYISSPIQEIAKPKQEQKELSILSTHEQSLLVSHLNRNTDLAKTGVLLSLYTGIRLGELCALKWADIDLENRIIRINKTLQRINSTDPYSATKTMIIIDKPKSQKSIRNIPIPSFLFEKLKVNTQSGNTYFLTGNRTYAEPRAFQRIFKRLLKEAGLRDINFHAIRHTFATRGIENGFDIKTLSEILGHSSVKFTLDRYVHPSDELKRQSIEKLVSCY